jgi:hypothetical protein
MEIDEKIHNEAKEFEVLQTVIGALQKLPDEARARILRSSATFLEIGLATSPASVSERESMGTQSAHGRFSENRDISPKEFLHDKQPKSNVERVACLAYYLTHYRETPYFKTVDLNSLNTEAAQPKFSNAAMAVADATKQGYLVPATKGQKQISAIGERFIVSLPDREAAKLAMANSRPKRKVRRQRAPKERSKED